MLGIVLMAIFAIAWPILPVAGGFPFGHVPGFDLETARLVAWHAVLPAASIVLASLGTWAVAMRGMVVSVLGEDYMTLAEAKGLGAPRIFMAYGMRNALLPQMTQLALKLLREADAANQRAAYLCFNRALADHMALAAGVNAPGG